MKILSVTWWAPNLQHRNHQKKTVVLTPFFVTWVDAAGADWGNPRGIGPSISPQKWADAAKDMQALEANAEIPVEVNAINAYEDWQWWVTLQAIQEIERKLRGFSSFGGYPPSTLILGGWILLIQFNYIDIFAGILGPRYIQDIVSLMSRKTGRRRKFVELFAQIRRYILQLPPVAIPVAGKSPNVDGWELRKKPVRHGGFWTIHQMF